MNSLRKLALAAAASLLAAPALATTYDVLEAPNSTNRTAGDSVNTVGFNPANPFDFQIGELPGGNGTSINTVTGQGSFGAGDLVRVFVAFSTGLDHFTVNFSVPVSISVDQYFGGSGSDNFRVYAGSTAGAVLFNQNKTGGSGPFSVGSFGAGTYLFAINGGNTSIKRADILARATSAPVPLPASLPLLVIGLGGLLALQRGTQR